MSQEIYQTGARRRAFSSRHYPIAIDVRYKVLSNSTRVKSGSGKTVMLSSTDIEFETPHALPPGATIELSLAWPANLNGSVGLNLFVTGIVEGSPAGRISVSIRRHEFRTRYIPPEAPEKITGTSSMPANVGEIQSAAREQTVS